MRQNNSPWLTQLSPLRAPASLVADHATDIVIVGAGISGIATLFFLLKYTKKKITVIDAHRVAHGATGHNAGQVVAEFEKPIVELIHEHGLKKTIEGIRAVEGAWDLVAEIFTDTQIPVPFKEVIGYGGYAKLEQLMEELETEYIKHEHGLITFPVMVSRESQWMKQIPTKFHSICTEVDQSLLSELLEVAHDSFHGLLAHKAAVMNSALFTEELARWCLETFPGRCQIYENTFVHGIELALESPKVITNEATITTREIVLCTNGFENFYIHDKDALAIDTKFHHEVHGVVGYMTGFVSEKKYESMANYYYPEELMHTHDPYYYVTRRKFGEQVPTLTIIGGPEIRLENREIYHRDYEVADEFHQGGVQFMRENFDMSDQHEKFFWHGLMGYTKSGVRMAGREPLDGRLMYNLGCNGIGILPAIMGAKKITDHVNGFQLPDSIFDPKR